MLEQIHEREQYIHLIEDVHAYDAFVTRITGIIKSFRSDMMRFTNQVEISELIKKMIREDDDEQKIRSVIFKLYETQAKTEILKKQLEDHIPYPTTLCFGWCRKSMGNSFKIIQFSWPITTK